MVSNYIRNGSPMASDIIKNPNLQFIEDNISRYKIFALQGGTRSGKTYSALQFIIKTVFRYRGLVISICRQSLPILRATAMRDFIDIMSEADLYSEANHNKSTNEYFFNGNTIEFFGLDEEQKLRGRKRHLLFINELNENSFDKWQQLLFRTSGKIIGDYNPSMNESWIYDSVLTRKDCGTIITTYRDNPFLEKEIIKEIELTKETDENTWNIYGMGQRGVSSNHVYPNYEIIDEIPLEWKRIYGLDFGYNAPTALVEVGYKENNLAVKEILYQRGMTNGDLIRFLKDNIDRRVEIYADNAEPDRIEEIFRAGFKVKPAKKDITAGIDSVKAYKLLITKHSKNIFNEQKTYKYKVDKNNKLMDEPVEFNDHALDALRYAVFTHLRSNRIISPASFSYAELKRNKN